jgi:hypothetical protein
MGSTTETIPHLTCWGTLINSNPVSHRLNGFLANRRLANWRPARSRLTGLAGFGQIHRPTTFQKLALVLLTNRQRCWDWGQSIRYRGRNITLFGLKQRTAMNSRSRKPWRVCNLRGRKCPQTLCLCEQELLMTYYGGSESRGGTLSNRDSAIRWRNKARDSMFRAGCPSMRGSYQVDKQLTVNFC